MMQTQLLAQRLRELLAADACRLLRLVEDARPYVNPRTSRLWNQMRDVGQTCRRHSNRISRILDELPEPLPPRPVQPDVVKYSYQSVEDLLPDLIEQLKRQLTLFDEAIDAAEGDASIVDQLVPPREETRQHLDALEAEREQLAGA